MTLLPDWLARPDEKVAMRFGKVSENVCLNIWNLADKAQRHCMAWDVPRELRAKTFTLMAMKAGLCGTGFYRGRLCGIAMASPLCKNSQTYECHFMFCQRLDSSSYLALGELFQKGLSCLASLAICIVPSRFFGANQFLKAMNFNLSLKMPKAIIANGRLCHALLWSKKLEEFKL